ncbi:hypothetical protein [uncultured Psychroserpens sp.]|uniref:hypothetical protein n=1 Tax=uncultured Psychroserpens sp. TaxID=255436 RepID=UPI002609BEC6|nr:hypothetical protein [uncultured Psychroserpens sp.]
MKNIFYITCLTLVSFVSCKQSQNNISFENKNMKFSETQIIDLIEIIEKDDHSINKREFYYHFRYDDFLNENTTIIDLVKNEKKPSLEDGISDVVKYKGSYIFIYETLQSLSKEKLNYVKENDLISATEASPFFVPDSKYWNLYIRNENDGLIVKSMRQLMPTAESNNLNESIDF